MNYRLKVVLFAALVLALCVQLNPSLAALIWGHKSEAAPLPAPYGWELKQNQIWPRG
jgi:hypothetical protein